MGFTKFSRKIIAIYIKLLFLSFQSYKILYLGLFFSVVRYLNLTPLNMLFSDYH